MVKTESEPERLQHLSARSIKAHSCLDEKARGGIFSARISGSSSDLGQRPHKTVMHFFLSCSRPVFSLHVGHNTTPNIINHALLNLYYMSAI